MLRPNTWGAPRKVALAVAVLTLGASGGAVAAGTDQGPLEPVAIVREAADLAPGAGPVALLGTGLTGLVLVMYGRSRRVPERLPRRSSHRRR